MHEKEDRLLLPGVVRNHANVGGDEPPFLRRAQGEKPVGEIGLMLPRPGNGGLARSVGVRFNSGSAPRAAGSETLRAAAVLGLTGGAGLPLLGEEPGGSEAGEKRSVVHRALGLTGGGGPRVKLQSASAGLWGSVTEWWDGSGDADARQGRSSKAVGGATSLQSMCNMGDAGTPDGQTPAKVGRRLEGLGALTAAGTPAAKLDEGSRSSSQAGTPKSPHQLSMSAAQLLAALVGDGTVGKPNNSNKATEFDDAAIPRRASITYRPIVHSLEGSFVAREPSVGRAVPAGRRRSMPDLVCHSPDRGPQRHIRHLEPQEKIFDLYSWDSVLQESGDGGKVVVCRPVAAAPLASQGLEYVMKIRSKSSLREQHHEEVFRKSQTRLLNIPPHVGVVPLREVLEDDNFYYIVMDKATGGSFLDSLVTEFEDGIVPPGVVKRLMRETLEALSHIHSQGILHRDIKPDNLVMQELADPLHPRKKVKNIMIIDFDHADPDFSPWVRSRPHHCYGTMRFNAPETLHGEYSASSDLYSVGAILYLLMTGKMPYDDSLFEEEEQAAPTMSKSRTGWLNRVHDSMQEADIDWKCNPWPDQPDCRDFCASLLAFDPAARPGSAEEALGHPWLLAY